MSWVKQILEKKSHILALSPMADMTDSAFCQVVRRIGGADIVFREMVSAEALIRDNAKTLGMTDFVPAERPIVQQIFGSDPDIMARAAAIVMEHAGPEGIDVNMGCPVYKITSNFNGCALMKEPDRAAAIVRAMKKAVGDDIPISVKIRLGWSDPDDFKKFIPVVEDAGVSLITVHGRTKAQGYSGSSDWARIAEAKAIARVPLLANGDIHEPSQVAEALSVTHADGVLIARGALGNPWFFRQSVELCRPAIGSEAQARRERITRVEGAQSVENLSVISLEERVRVVLEHARLHIAEYGERGMVSFRKHLSWYFKTNKVGFEIPGIKEIRGKLVQVSTYDELETILKDLLVRSNK